MRSGTLYLLLFFFLFSVASLVHGQAVLGRPVAANGNPLSEKEQTRFLERRLPISAFRGTFASYGELLYAADGVSIHTESHEISETALGSPFPSFYHPTFAELFDSIAIQTKSSWKYDPTRNFWVFSISINPRSFQLSPAANWTSSNRGIYVGFKPPNYPVGMDVYQLGSYSTDSSEKATLFEKVRNDLALRFATGANPNVTVKDMGTETLDGAEALFFEAPSPIRKDVVWRQWALVKNGKAFVIVSSLPRDDTTLFNDVKSMVKSFHVR